MNHLGTLNIETDRLLLRRFMKSDALSIYKNWATDSEVTKYLTWMPHENVEVTKNIVNTWIEFYDSKEYYNCAIVPKDYGKVIGSIAVVNRQDDHDICEIGYCIGRDYWNRGLATEAMKGVINFMLHKVGYNRLHAYHHAVNKASGKVMQKSGMMFEGRLRQYHKNTAGEHVDCDMYSILKEEI